MKFGQIRKLERVKLLRLQWSCKKKIENRIFYGMSLFLSLFLLLLLFTVGRIRYFRSISDKQKPEVTFAQARPNYIKGLHVVFMLFSSHWIWILQWAMQCIVCVQFFLLVCKARVKRQRQNNNAAQIKNVFF